MEIKCFGSGSSGNCYLVTFENGMNFLLELGVKPDKVKKVINMNYIDLAFVSHLHQDHCGYLKQFALSRVFIELGVNYKVVTKKVINAKFGKGKAMLTFIPVKHGDEPNTGLIIQTKEEELLFITDFNSCDANLKKFKFNKIMVECNYIERYADEKLSKLSKKSNDYWVTRRQINTHMGLEGLKTFLDTLDLSKCDEIILIHKSQHFDDYDLMEVEMATSLMSRYNIDVSVAKRFGGVNKYECNK